MFTASYFALQDTTDEPAISLASQPRFHNTYALHCGYPCNSDCLRLHLAEVPFSVEVCIHRGMWVGDVTLVNHFNGQRIPILTLYDTNLDRRQANTLSYDDDESWAHIHVKPYVGSMVSVHILLTIQAYFTKQFWQMGDYLYTSEKHNFIQRQIRHWMLWVNSDRYRDSLRAIVSDLLTIGSNLKAVKRITLLITTTTVILTKFAEYTCAMAKIVSHRPDIDTIKKRAAKLNRSHIFCDADVENTVHNNLFGKLIASGYVRDLFRAYTPQRYIPGVASMVSLLLQGCTKWDQQWIRRTHQNRRIRAGACVEAQGLMQLQKLWMYDNGDFIWHSLCYIE